MDCKFFAGQKVVCINDRWWHVVVLHDGSRVVNPAPAGSVPEINKIYKIRAIGLSDLDRRPVVWLHEFAGTGFAHCFDAKGFRPLQDRPKEADTDISVFTPLLDVTRFVKKREDA
jgi:hypothetical protein